ncbi:metallophosphoesterase family protein [Methylocapsa acidiphila]|uniref:metallophosphoesterase family protein n=1 Tax=Methylocapsa acidiphila TaxID=133552 RepID=UPI00040D0F6D|nr:metallophosphoesterase family protein [Methylocapsa acidiphila]
MWKSPLFRSADPVRPAVPDGLRIYATGDIHGRADLLDQLFLRIDQDLEARPIERAVEVFLGDYIDRGPDSAGVLNRLIRRAETHQTLCLKGNHEVCLVEFLENPAILKDWARFGALTTLLSYGLKPSINAGPMEQAALAEELSRTIPASHRRFLAELPLSFTCGDYFFVHAGVRPGAPLSRQRDEDLLWIREDFLAHEEPFEKVIVHGHTPTKDPEVRPNRIGIDTGAYATGRLTCLWLEGDNIGFL